MLVLTRFKHLYFTTTAYPVYTFTFSSEFSFGNFVYFYVTSMLHVMVYLHVPAKFFLIITCVFSLILQITITAALGFDSFLVMRHGAGPVGSIQNSQPETLNNVSAGMVNLSLSSQNESQRLGCYFCNDVVAPIDVRFLYESDGNCLTEISLNMNPICSLCSQPPTVP